MTIEDPLQMPPGLYRVRIEEPESEDDRQVKIVIMFEDVYQAIMVRDKLDYCVRRLKTFHLEFRGS